MTTRGRPNGRYLHAEAFEAICAARNLLKKDACADAGISAGFLTDLLALRAGASPDVVSRLASTLGVQPAALFPELSPNSWIPPLPDREARRVQVA